MKVQRTINTEELQKILLKYFNITDGNVSFAEIVTLTDGEEIECKIEKPIIAIVTENGVEPVRRFEY